jgi:hypothetical protein
LLVATLVVLLTFSAGLAWAEPAQQEVGCSDTPVSRLQARVQM